MLAFIRYRISVFQLAIQNLKIKIYRTISLLVFYECKTLSLTQRYEHTPKVVENSVLKRVFGLERDEMTGELRKLHNEELNDLFSPNIFSGNQIKKNEMGGASSAYEERRSVYSVWLEDLRERYHLGDPGVNGMVILR